MSSPTPWYIVKQADGSCAITANNPTDLLRTSDQEPTQPEYWGPFDSPDTAIARRVGLIRAGKCQPVQPSPPGD